MKRMLSPQRWEDQSSLATRLTPRPVARPWGRAVLPHLFSQFARGGEPIGEVWHEAAAATHSRLLIKHLFTADRLSIQVHPNARQASLHGLAGGKDEAWLILDAEPGAVIGLGLNRPVTQDELRAAALDGSIERLIDWRPVRAGDMLSCPGGTIHAIGGGISLIEVQQNTDITYRLYDHGRPRPLHLDDGLSVAACEPAPVPPPVRSIGEGRELLLAGDHFVLERWRMTEAVRLDGGGAELLIIPLTACGLLDGLELRPGEVWRIETASSIRPAGALDVLAAYPGSAVRPDLVARL